ncbi:ParB/RepB/Spo0J family partition protein [Enhydrobacter aerosaccus]|uniref:ParB/RepB/Spo0J family partition protein n=1 Tax=Enhydrobacter aerosaccus TaxID=225324 RepID=A0A1T4TK15_9HYPH|nr:ParB/RepB/Spo0J family partition protein [Enhydrobacter aerosaccus]SKA40579.1 ParB/RepB/Spo0J family partition protein [Enhydrobacter aerosaccus]
MFIEISKLSVAAENPRTTPAEKAAHDRLVASMRAHGQLVPIIIRANGKPDHYEIIDGGRRFAAAKEAGLLGLEGDVYAGSIAGDELGTVANMMRAPMHPLDEARVIARAIADGDTAENVAARFGHPARWAEQRLKLDGLSDKAKKVFRAGDITLAAAEAFTLSTKSQQDTYLKSVRTEWQLNAAEIRRALTNQAIPSHFAIFDLDKYPASAVTRDLFGEEIWLTDREAFDRLQREHLQLDVESLQSEGWGAVELLEGQPYLWDSYVRVEGKIGKAKRASMHAFVIYNPASGEVKIERGWITRQEAKKAKKGKHPKDDSADAEEVKAQTLYDLSKSQVEMLGALQTEALARAIANGDTWLALKTLLSPMLGEVLSHPAWAGVRPSFPNFIGVNVMFDTKVELPEVAETPFPSRAAFEKMPWDKVMEFVRAAALRSLTLLYSPNDEAVKELKASGTTWFRYDTGFLRRYRLDALQDLAKQLKIDSAGLKKRELVERIAQHEGAASVVPLKRD